MKVTKLTTGGRRVVGHGIFVSAPSGFEMVFVGDHGTEITMRASFIIDTEREDAKNGRWEIKWDEDKPSFALNLINFPTGSIGGTGFYDAGIGAVDGNAVYLSLYVQFVGKEHTPRVEYTFTMAPYSG
jgi:hypothetical protein